MMWIAGVGAGAAVHAGDRGDGVGTDDVVAGAAEQGGRFVLTAEIVVAAAAVADEGADDEAASR